MLLITTCKWYVGRYYLWFLMCPFSSSDMLNYVLLYMLQGFLKAQSYLYCFFLLGAKSWLWSCRKCSLFLISWRTFLPWNHQLPCWSCPFPCSTSRSPCRQPPRPPRCWGRVSRWSQRGMKVPLLAWLGSVKEEFLFRIQLCITFKQIVLVGVETTFSVVMVGFCCQLLVAMTAR